MFHVVWMLCWFIAAVEWAVAQNILNGVMVSIVEDQLKENCNTTSIETSGYVQAAIGDVSYDCSNDIFTHLEYVFYHNLYTCTIYSLIPRPFQGRVW